MKFLILFILIYIAVSIGWDIIFSIFFGDKNK